MGKENISKTVLNARDDVSKIIDSRLNEFQDNYSSDKKIISELFFCICTANNSAERGLAAQEKIDFENLPEDELRGKMKEIVCRFYNNKTDYTLFMRENKPKILKALRKADSGPSARTWITKNIKGLGMKEASHFLRNIGFSDLAIIDFHIVDLLVRENLIKRPKSITQKEYLNTEQVLSDLAWELKMGLDELDLYLWYIETGKVLK